MPKPWERQEAETPKAFYAFTLYRDMGYERSHSKVVQVYGKGKRLDWLIQRWSKKYDWVKRVVAYDDYLDAVRRKEQEKAIVDMRDRHTKIAMGLQGKGASKLLKEGYTIKSDRDAIHAIKEGAMLERLSRGEATEKIESQVRATITTTDPIPWENIPEVKKAVEKLRERMKKEKNADDAKSKT